jgi:4-amino-4-deoxy-L-arabinose transferase-like glycosyltransferase
MKTIATTGRIAAVEKTGERGFAVETTFVLFFLAVECGHSMSVLALDTFVLALTLAAFIVLPYFLPAEDKPDFGRWVLGRSLIAALGVGLGMMYKQTLGVVLPEMLRYLPMTLLIVTAMLSCYIQFYGLLKIRLAK